MSNSIDLVKALMLLVEEGILRHEEDEPLRRLLMIALNDLRRLHERCSRDAGVFKVAIVGLGNVGKSTLINALLGTRVAPVRNGPCTAGIVEFRHGAEHTIRVTDESLVPEVHRFKDTAALRDRLSEITDHGSGEIRAGSRIVVTLPVALLAEGLSLIDTPGFGAANGVGTKDDETITRFLREDVAQIFWVVMSGRGIQPSEQRIYETLLADRCDDLVVTNIDERDETYWKTKEEPFYRKLVSSRTRIHPVSGKGGDRARANQDIAAWEQSGMDLLEARIKKLASVPNRIDVVADGIRHLGEEMTLRLKGAEFRRLRGAVFRPTRASEILALFGQEPEISTWAPLLTRR